VPAWRLDVLVNCVGIFGFYRGLADLGEELDEAFDEMFRANVKSQLVPVKAALAELRRSRGSVVLTVPTSGFYPGRGGILYVASKFAVRGCVVALAHALAPEIRVNGVAPGGTLGTQLAGPASMRLAWRSLGATPSREEELTRPPGPARAPGDVSRDRVISLPDLPGMWLPDP
jgi:NAD(P)-dependent dehydrogenase (short-subunit alcohol dehydrogenase family)